MTRDERQNKKDVIEDDFIEFVHNFLKGKAGIEIQPIVYQSTIPGSRTGFRIRLKQD